MSCASFGSWFLALGGLFLFLFLTCTCLVLHECFLNTHTLPGFPNTYTSPQLKPSYGICRDPTTTVGAHRGAVAVLSGVSIRTGSCAAGRVLSGLICRICDLHQRQRGVLRHQRGDSTSRLSLRSSLTSSTGSSPYPNHTGEIRVEVGNPSQVSVIRISLGKSELRWSGPRRW